MSAPIVDTAIQKLMAEIEELKKRVDQPKIAEKTGQWDLGLDDGNKKSPFDLSDEDETDENKGADDDEFSGLFCKDADKQQIPEGGMDEILKDIEENIEYGPDLLLNVAEGFGKTVSRPLKKETSDKLREALKIPGNCKGFLVPKMNPEIWSHLPPAARMNDVKIQQLQKSLSIGLITLASIANEVAAAQILPATKNKLMKMSIDGANLLGDQLQSTSQQRRGEVRRLLNPEYSSICSSQFPASEFLFGDNLSDTLKNSKTASSVIRGSFNKGNRFQPYQSRGSLNYQRPFSRHQQQYQPRRGNQGQYRGRSSFQMRKRYNGPQNYQTNRTNFQ